MSEAVECRECGHDRKRHPYGEPCLNCRCEFYRWPQQPVLREALERCEKCGSPDLYRDYHAKTTCAEHCRVCHKYGCCDLQGNGRGEHFYRSCRGCHFAWMEAAPLATPTSSPESPVIRNEGSLR